nr:hypothetical protein [Tanacetum cinerariifolium]
MSLRRVVPTNYDPKGERFLIASHFSTPPLVCAFFIPRATVTYRLNPRYAIKECSSCGTLYTRDCSYSKGNVEDKILIPKPPKNCARCGHPVDGLYCQGCTFLQKKLKEDLVTHFQGFQNTFESSNDSTNIVNVPLEQFVVKQDHGSFVDKIICDALGDGEACQRCTCKRCGSGLSKGLCLICRNNQNSPNDSPISAKSSHNPPHIDERCFECGDALDGIFCQRCACKSCGKAWDRVSKIKDAFGNEQYKLEDVQELFHKLLNDVQNIHEELAEYINTPGWNRPTFYNNGDDDVDYTIAITPVLSTEEPDKSLSMGDEHPDTILATESDEVIKSSVEDLVPILSESEGIPDTMCDVHLVNNPTPLEAKDHFEIVINSNDDYSSSDDDSLYYRNIDTTTQSDISLLEYDLFIFDLSNDQFPPTDRSDFTHEEFGDEPAHIISPPEYDCFYFRDFPDPGELISSLNSRIRENLSSTTCVNLPVEDDYSPFLAYVVWIFLAYLTYPVLPLRLYSFGNEDTIFDPGITINCSYSFKPGLSHPCGTFKKFNTHRSHLKESPTEMLFSTLFPMDQ